MMMYGEMLFDLDGDWVLGYCKNLIGFSCIGYYDGFIFYCIIVGFMI